MPKGQLYIVSAPSGAGKSSLIQALLAAQSANRARVSVSHTTRRARPGEVDGEHYFFVDHAQFEQMVAQQAFLEYAQVFDQYYGTSKARVEQLLESGVDVLLDIDWQGARQVRRSMPDACGVFILPPSTEELHRRLCARGQDSEAVIQRRMAQAAEQASHYDEYDYVIVNHDFASALADLQAIIRATPLRRALQSQRQAGLISKLVAG